MIAGLVLRNFKIYKNINYTPLSNGDSLTGLIGVNGIGKSSILEALDCYFNYKPWNFNINLANRDNDASYIVPIFIIEKKEIDFELIEIAEKYSDVIWEVLQTPHITPSIINTNYKDFIEQIKVTISYFRKVSKDTHFILPLGVDSNGNASNSIFRGDFILDKFTTLDSLSDEMNSDDKYSHIAGTYILPLLTWAKEYYDYIYIPKDIEPQGFVQFETNEIQILLGENLEKIISKHISKAQINAISHGLKDFINSVSESIPGYKYKYASSYQPNLKHATIYNLIAKEFFSVRELHKESEDGKDLLMKYLSSGEKQQAVLSLIFYIVFNYREDSSKLIIAIDEPESSLHISACYDQFDRIYELSRKCKQVLFSSHWYGFIPAINSGAIINISNSENKYSHLLFDISKYREEIKIQDAEYKKANHRGLPMDIMLKSSNDFIQSILSSIIKENPYNWLICEGSSELIYFNYYLNDEISNKNLRIVPVGGAKEIRKIYNYLAVSIEELKANIKGSVILIMDTDEQLLEFETKRIPHLNCFRIVNNSGKKETELIDINANPKSPKTELEDILNGQIFYETLKTFKNEYLDLLSFVDEEEIKEPNPSYFALDLRPSELENLNAFFDADKDNKVLFANKYIEFDKDLTGSVPEWIMKIKGMI